MQQENVQEEKVAETPVNSESESTQPLPEVEPVVEPLTDEKSEVKKAVKEKKVKQQSAAAEKPAKSNKRKADSEPKPKKEKKTKKEKQVEEDLDILKDIVKNYSYDDVASTGVPQSEEPGFIQKLLGGVATGALVTETKRGRYESGVEGPIGKRPKQHVAARVDATKENVLSVLSEILDESITTSDLETESESETESYWSECSTCASDCECSHCGEDLWSESD